MICPLGFLAGSMIFYWAGFEQLNGVVAAVFVGLPIYALFAGPTRGRINRAAGVGIGVPFLAVWVVTQYFGPLGKDALPFPAFFALCLVEVVGFFGLVWLASDAEGRREVQAAWWLPFMIFSLYLLSYYGSYGPLQTPVVAPSYDDLIAAALGLVSYYYWALASGYQTKQMHEIAAEAKTTVVSERSVN